MLEHTVILLLLTVGFLDTKDLEIVARYDSAEDLTNLQFYNNTFYIGANNSVHMLNNSLSLQKEVLACENNNKSCGNVNQVLAVDSKNQLLICCWTGKFGTCEERDLSNLTVLFADSTIYYLKVAGDRKRPAHAHVTEEGISVFSVTFGSGFEIIHQYIPISIRTIHFGKFEGPGTLKESYLKLSGKLDRSNYIIYYKGQISIGNTTFLITNQKRYVGSSFYVSKLVKVSCLNIYTYVDMEITCTIHNKTYNLVQDAVLIKHSNDMYIIFTFSSGEDPEQPITDSALCAANVSFLEDQLYKAKVKDATTNCVKPDSERYLSSTKDGNCYNESASEAELQEHFGFGCEPVYPHSNVIANEVLHLDFKMELLSTLITTLHAAEIGGKSVLLAGDESGSFYMLNFDGKNLSIYHKQTITSPIKYREPTYPVRAIFVQDDDSLYVMTSQEMLKLQQSKCDQFTSCDDVMEGKDPVCGWCIYQDRASRHASCQGRYWIPAVGGKCLSISSNVTAVEIKPTELAKVVSLWVDQEVSDDYKYKCKYTKTNYSVDANLTSGVFTCSFPNVTSHTNEILQLRVESTDIILGSVPILFFDCSTFKRCRECVNLCSWCPDTAQCVSKSAGCSITQNSSCPRLRAGNRNIIPSSVSYPVNFTAENLNTSLKYQCQVLNVAAFPAKVHNNTISCNLTVSANAGSVDYSIVIMYSRGETYQAELDDGNNTKVTVYDCNRLGTDCSYCQALGKYNCFWNRSSCEYGSNQKQTCRPPNVIEIVPDNAAHNVSIYVTLKGTDFGNSSSTFNVKLSGIDCVNVTKEKCNFPKSLPNVEGDLTCQVSCKTGKINETSEYVKKPGPVSIRKDGENFRNASVFFYYRIVQIFAISPLYGPRAGGTRITLSGTDLGVGGQKYRVQLQSAFCNEVDFDPPLPQNPSYEERMKNRKNYSIVCTTPGLNINVTHVLLTAGERLGNYSLTQPFEFLPDPEVNQESLKSVKGILSGGTHKTFTGKYLRNAHTAGINGTYRGKPMTPTKCYFGNDTEQKEQTAICPLPPAPGVLRSTFKDSAKSRRKRAADCESNLACIQLQVFFDGVSENFTIIFFEDPSLDNFTEVRLITADNRTLIIHGQNINDVATKSDVTVTIGSSECRLLNLEKNFLTCEVPESEPDKANPDSPAPEVKVKIGNLNFDVGYIAYKKELDLVITIAAAAGGGTLAVVVIVLVIAICKCRKIQKKANEYQKELAEIEMNIVKVVREEFLDMHTTMSTVNRNLVEQGFPYHSYQQYACNVMFSVDYLWTEPVVSNGEFHDYGLGRKLKYCKFTDLECEMTDDERIRANKGMEQFESLIYNKFFLFSVISTLEKEKRFFIKEKSNFAGNLCAVLMGKMDYLEEMMKMLLSNHVQETPSKKQKTLFRRCESITEKLLSNWLSLCLYPHIKAHSSSPLYLLYVAIQKTMESGPIDAITHDAKYTLCEEKLLKKWSSTAEESGSQDIKFEAKTLTLNLVVDNGEEIFKCKVLDCDTISQVKSKCMAQIYVNFPASQLSVHPDELALEWHEGFGGALKLRDEDNTSKQDGHWLRLNTLAHYNVKDDSNMALVDPTCDGVKEEDYVNLTHVNIDVGSNGSFDSSEPLAPKDEENPNPLERWHLVKKEEETSKQGKSAIAELYLNRLLTTKQCVIEYVRTLWDTILDKNRCPPPVRFLFEYLDELGERGKVDPDTLHAWKSHSYAIRVWGSLMKMPALLFDIEIPSYMDDSLEVISQVFIESFSPDTQKVTKDSASWKLIFNNEVISLRDKVKDFYKNVKVDSQTPEEYRQYMEEVKRYQQETKFNKVSALYRLYKQIKPFIDDIVEDLSESQASSLQLDKKLEKVMEIMEAEEE